MMGSRLEELRKSLLSICGSLATSALALELRREVKNTVCYENQGLWLCKGWIPKKERKKNTPSLPPCMIFQVPGF
jgi:hypothetical protein